MVDQVGSGLRHAPRTARLAEPVALAAEDNQLVVTAVATAQAQEAARQIATQEERVELVLDELRQAGAGGGLDFGDEGRRVLLHRISMPDTPQRCVKSSSTLGRDRSAAQTLGGPGAGKPRPFPDCAARRGDAR
ncbi:MAG: hypothetical protein OEY03_02325 [Rhizobacter sp.]|nr:hypothetical protein [Rhizobacter sp.]